MQDANSGLAAGDGDWPRVGVRHVVSRVFGCKSRVVGRGKREMQTRWKHKAQQQQQVVPGG